LSVSVLLSDKTYLFAAFFLKSVHQFHTNIDKSFLNQIGIFFPIYTLSHN